MGTLYECLREAKLERYFPSFRAQGITKSEALTRLTASDYPAFGITSAEDKRRLVELISIIKAVHNVSDREDILSGHHPVNRSIQNVRNKSPRKRNRSPAQGPVQVGGRALSATNDVRVRDRLRANASSHHLSGAGAAILDLIDDEESSEESGDDSEEPADYEPAVKHSVTASVKELPGRIRKTPVEKVKYGAGYNYGVPGGSSGARPKSRPGGGRLHEDKIKVCVRKRPLSKRESRSGEEDMIQAASTTTLVVSEPKQAVDLTAYTLQHEFIFDEVFEEKCTNEDVYIRAARPLISCIFDGGNATCFAYGQTGAGKTHTMIGNREIPGLYLLAAHDIFSIIESGQYGEGIKVWVSFFEIYCGQLFDLLNKRNRLHAREDGSKRVCITGLTETEAVDEQSLMQVLEYGNSVRSKGATGVNPDSSRSHAVLQMEIRDRADKRLGSIN
ncbi:kinesin-like protein KIF24, partial [Ruditapes philippinarum]|uniref:kinesin-like protein KIF24 n=1 Tax=Ruditapes philippinarum TaxID=129788 RepID=UPI00295B7774